MQYEKSAELAVQIVVAAIQNGLLGSHNVKDVCDYYEKIHKQLLQTEKEANAQAQASFDDVSFESSEDLR